MNVIVQVPLPDDLKSAIDRQVAAGHARSDCDFLIEAARLYAEELDEDQDLWSIAQAGTADAEAGRFILIETEADAEALYERTMAQTRANLAADKTRVAYRLVGQANGQVNRILTDGARKFGIVASGR